jgi:predicted O-methyltransferase YrrM
MGRELWNAVDQYICEHSVAIDPTLDAALHNSDAAGLPAIAVAPNQGKLLYLLARAMGAKRILEVGTLGGYSTIWLARALPANGQVITLEMDPNHAEVARANFTRAGVQGSIDLRLGPALTTLPQLESEELGPFCLTFIDADKHNIPQYFDWAIKLSRPGSMIVVDNVVRNGALIDESSTDPNVIGVRKLHELIARESRVSATTIQTVGSKGHDGLTIAVVN